MKRKWNGERSVKEKYDKDGNWSKFEYNKAGNCIYKEFSSGNKVEYDDNGICIYSKYGSYEWYPKSEYYYKSVNRKRKVELLLRSID